MIKEKKWKHLSNTTDDMLLSWYRLSPLKKMCWLEEMREFYKKAVPKRKRAALRKAGLLK